ncbi:MAG: hypothetical protein ACR652_05710 [Methylocystis sp.]|uniref:hypothetical protein n=1 Tax=Methylocystis sp. TaxID=1911079 RepID=UPI003DA69489
MNDSEIQALADSVLRTRLGRFGFQRAEVRSGVDYSNDPAVYVDAVLGEGAPSLEPDTLMNAHLALSDALLEKGEERFPYLQTKRLGDNDRPEEVALKPFRGHA